MYPSLLFSSSIWDWTKSCVDWRLPSAVSPPPPPSLFLLSPFSSPQVPLYFLLPPTNSPSSASASQPPPNASAPPTVHAHTPLFPPLLISYPRVRYQSGEGLAEGVMKGWSWEPGRVRSAPSPRGERDRDNTYLPHMSIRTAPKPLHACFRMSNTYQDAQGNSYGEKSRQKTSAHRHNTPPTPSENSYKHWNKLFVPELTAQAIDRHVQSHALTSHRSI